jgi:predicted metal-dependent hydrolase
VRLVPEEPFPAYAFIPGRHPHPHSDPAGHSYGTHPATPPALDPERWQESRPYLRGLDLFNHGYYWESHETLEGLWVAAGRKGPVADFLKGLIKLSAAGVKHHEGKPAGVKGHARRAAELFRGAGTEGRFLGLPRAGLIDLAETVSREGWPEAAPLLAPTFPAGEGPAAGSGG